MHGHRGKLVQHILPVVGWDITTDVILNQQPQVLDANAIGQESV